LFSKTLLKYKNKQVLKRGTKKTEKKYININKLTFFLHKYSFKHFMILIYILTFKFGQLTLIYSISTIRMKTRKYKIKCVCIYRKKEREER